MLTRIFGPGTPRPPSFPSPEACAHTRLMGRYRNQVALGDERPMGYKCQRCYAEFLPGDPTVDRWRAGLAAAAAAAEAARLEAAQHAEAEAAGEPAEGEHAESDERDAAAEDADAGDADVEQPS